MNKKILLGSIIAVTILIGISTSSAVDVKTNDYNEIEQTDTTIEVISIIRGNFETFNRYENGVIFGHIYGRVHPAIGVNIISFTINPLHLFYSVTAKNHIDIPHFIGIIFWTAADNIIVTGIALGNIEWS